jgi:aspartate racemase
VRDLTQNLANKDARKQVEIFAALITSLKAAGAQAAAVTSMGGHFCIGELLPISPLPMLNGIPEVDAAVKRGKFKTVGIIGTRMSCRPSCMGQSDRQKSLPQPALSSRR